MPTNQSEKRNRSLFGNKRIKSNLELLQQSLTDLYQDTYYASRTDLSTAEKVRSDIEKSVENIMHNNLDNSSMGNITRMYDKISSMSGENKKLLDALKDLNDDTLTQTVLSSWTQNKWIYDLNQEIDMVLKYAPKLREALLCKKDCVLSADHFSKDFLNFTNIMSKEKEDLFNKRMEELRKIYRLPELIEEWYDRAQTYGEQYIYITPYNREFERMLKNKNNSLGWSSLDNPIHESAVAPDKQVLLGESATTTLTLNKNTVLQESVSISDSALEMAHKFGYDKIKVSINMTGFLESSVEGLKKATALNEAGLFNSGIGKIFTEQYLTEASSKDVKLKKNKDVGSKTKFAAQMVPDDLKFDDKTEDEKTPSEMLITKEVNKEERIKINVPGCAVKSLVLENLLPQYIEDTCLGYLYVEADGVEIAFDDPQSFEYAAGFNTVSNTKRMSRAIDQYNMEDKNKIINHIAGEIYKMIDARFINNNQDLRRELYMILKHNELFNSKAGIQDGHIKISFLSADDVHPIIFNRDPITHRGESDLKYSMFPAKLYACLYITNVLGIITRGQDKRVYYVKQTVDTNIHKTLLNVINQVKKGNFGARQMENLGNILNITGKFNDVIIPTNSSGEPPINMEILEGQRFTDNSELMTMLEKMMIDPTDVPYDLIESRQSLDYAIQATMSNSKLMRNTYKRQDVLEDLCSPIVSKIYNYEYEDNEEIKVTLPAPAFLNATNGQQLMEQTKSFLTSMAESELADESDEVRAEFIRLGIRHYIPSHMDINLIDRLKIEARINVGKKLNTQNEQ